MANSKSEPVLSKAHTIAGISVPQQLHNEIDANSKLSAKALASLVGIAGISRPSNTHNVNNNRENSPTSDLMENHGASSHNLLAANRTGSPGMTRFTRRPPPPSLSSTVRIVKNCLRPAATLRAIKDTEFDASKSAVQQFAEEPKVQTLVNRTYLHPPIEKPSNAKLISKRQNHHERLGAKQRSPQMQLHLSHINGNAAANEDYHTQSFQRTMPISWCAAGGTDTHKKQTINTELHNEISMQLRKSVQDQYQQAIDHHKSKIQTKDEVRKSMLKVKLITMYTNFACQIIILLFMFCHCA